MRKRRGKGVAQDSDLVRFAQMGTESRLGLTCQVRHEPGGVAASLPPGTGDLLVTTRNTRNKSMFMGFLRFSARNKGWVCYELPEWFRLMFTEVVTSVTGCEILTPKACKISLARQ